MFWCASFHSLMPRSSSQKYSVKKVNDYDGTLGQEDPSKGATGG